MASNRENFNVKMKVFLKSLGRDALTINKKRV